MLEETYFYTVCPQILFKLAHNLKNYPVQKLIK